MKTMITSTFAIGQKVACHHPDGYNIGVVTHVDGDKVTAEVSYHEYQKDGSVTAKVSLREFSHREQDGLFVAAQSIEEFRPQWMLSTLENSVSCWQWRQNKPVWKKAQERIVDLALFARWIITPRIK